MKDEQYLGILFITCVFEGLYLIAYSSCTWLVAALFTIVVLLALQYFIRGR